MKYEFYGKRAPYRNSSKIFKKRCLEDGSTIAPGSQSPCGKMKLAMRKHPQGSSEGFKTVPQHEK